MSTPRRIWCAVASCSLLLALQPFDAAAGPRSKLDFHLQKTLKGDSGTYRVIVRVKAGQRGLVKQTLRLRGHAVSRDHAGIDAESVEVSARTLRALENNPNVESISTDADLDGLEAKKSRSTKTTSSKTTPSTSPLDNTIVSSLLKTLGLGNFGMGSSIGVAVFDSGLTDNGNFTGRIVEFGDFTGSTPTFNLTPFDDYGHGSHVAGLIGSSGVVSSGKYDGVAQTVRFVVLKVLDKNGRGKTSSLIDSIEYVIANKDRLGIHVINLSLGHPIFESAATDPLVQAVERASRAGLIVVAAAGNVGKNSETGLPGYGGIASPGNAPSAITVGAANTLDTAARSDDRVAGYSSRGPSWYDGFAKPDVVAPGHLLVSDAPALSTLSTTYPSLVINESQRSYLKLSGTSMSTGGSPPL